MNEESKAGKLEEGEKRSSAPHISLPKGGGAIRGIGEKFAANPVTGTGSMSVPISTSPGRSGFGPQLSLIYDSGSGNGPFGFGWNLSLPSITRKTDKGLPKYQDGDESDTFILSGTEDLVPVFKKKANGGGELDAAGNHVIDEINRDSYRVRRYRPRVEGLFARIEKWTSENDPKDVCWRSISKDNITTWYGKTENSRIADPDDEARIFSWLICQSYDDKGNAITYEYAEENSQRIFEDQHGQSITLVHERNRDDKSRSANRYLKRIKYGNRVPNRNLTTWQATDPTELKDWMFEVVFDYLPIEEDKEAYGQHYKQLTRDADGQLFVAEASTKELKTWGVRQDPFSSYKAGFEIRTYRLCHQVMMFHHFPDELGIDDYLVRSTEFTYEPSPIASFITRVTQSGYKYDRDKKKYLKKSLPPLEFEYSKAVINKDIQEIDAESIENLPNGLDGSRYQWVDLDGEGISGILTEQADAWFYKPNRGNGQFGPLELVAAKPSLAALSSGQQQLLDLAGDGQLDLVELNGPAPGFYERTHEERWEQFKPFVSLPNIPWNDPNMRFIDLTGDGHADVLITENEVFNWYPSLAEEGFGQAESVRQALDEEKGPKLVFADGTQSIYLADLSGDGLPDLARIRNGEVCYWPNRGYGLLGAKVTMDNSPWFDSPDQFDQRRIRTADIDGSGTTDIIYLGTDTIRIYRNQCGNSWGKPETLKSFPPVDNLSSVIAVDLLGTGTACLVWSSPLPGNMQTPMKYIDLMKQGKPHLLIKTVNNLGAETRVGYAPSTKFYLKDKEDEKPWITKLPFPVHVVERVETYDYISRNRFVTRYAYHHGYFDGEEREFRGFGRVEQQDTEQFATFEADGLLKDADNLDRVSHVPPVVTKTWFHTGAYIKGGKISRHFESEYYREPGLNVEDSKKLLLDDTVLPDELSPEEEREACRALKGSMLRQEVYALDKNEKENIPYTVTEQNFTIKRLQPRDGNRYAIFFTHPREAITYHYERDHADPRIGHAMTLEVGEFGNVLKETAIGYGRREKIRIVDDQGRVTEIQNPGLDGLDPHDQKKQTQTLMTYTENRVTNAIESADDYRIPLPCETRTYELTGYTPTGAAGRFQHGDFVQPDANDPKRLAHIFDTEIRYEDQSTNGKQRRLIEHVRTVYRKNDLTGFLELGALESLALPGEVYKLALTPGLLNKVFKRKQTGQPDENLLPNPGPLLEGKGADQGGYVAWDSNWWIPSGQVFYHPGADISDPAATAAQELTEAKQHFFLPRKYSDPFGNCTKVDYDAPYDLFLAKAQDAVGNSVEAVNDYRVLQPKEVIDPNENHTEAVFDSLGMLVGTAIKGKVAANNKTESGDSLEGFISDLTQSEVDTFFNAPKSEASKLLSKTTTRIIYDMDSYFLTGDPNRPPYAATLARERHVADVPDGETSPIQVSFTFSDGFGREIQKKIQAEPGDVEGVHTDNRWVVTGWTIFNNKGKPVRQYEPFFSNTHDFEFNKQHGVSSTLFYDPLERVVATLHPNHTYEKVVFDPWNQETWDVNDTVTLDPSTDADVKGFFVDDQGNERLPKGEYSPTWYAQRMGGGLGPEEQTAADKTAKHADTPTIAFFDTLGRTFLTIADNGKADDGSEQKYETRIEIDIEGNQRKVIDAKDRIVMKYDYYMAGPEQNQSGSAPNLIHQASMDAGERWMLNDVMGKPIRAWDSRKFKRRMTYDALRRPIGLFVTENGSERLAERTVYGENQGDASNHRSRVYQIFDGAGVVTNESYDFKGNLWQSKRELLPNYQQAVDWLQNPIANDGAFTTKTKYDALNRPLAITTPDNSVYHPTFNEANLLDKVDVNLHMAATPTEFVRNINYNAKGQRERIEYGNGVVTKYDYDKKTFRLTHIKTTRPTGLNGPASQLFANPAIIQDIHYTYDPVGNITNITDDAIPTIQYNNENVKPNADYIYDAIYRLIFAYSREHIGQTAFDFNPPDGNYRDYPFVGLRASPNDPKAVRNYTETYDYDEVGNIKSVRHSALNGNWTRTYTYDEPSLLEAGKKNNRLTHTQVGNGINSIESYGYTDTQGNDVHGCMTSINSMKMVWDFEDQLQQVDLGGGGTAYYVYDAAGQRVRKVIESRNGTRQKERIYLGGFEIYREYNGNGITKTLERETLHIMDNKQRIALAETQTFENMNPVNAPLALQRYRLGNHLGSTSVELDENGELISYEEYHPYGTTSFQAGRTIAEVSLKRYRYTGKEWDEESGLYYHGARYYVPWLGRWCSSDPTGLTDGVNVYCFTRCSPISQYDRTGTRTVRPETIEKKPLKYPAEVEETRSDAQSIQHDIDAKQESATFRLIDKPMLICSAEKSVTCKGIIEKIATHLGSLDPIRIHELPIVSERITAIVGFENPPVIIIAKGKVTIDAITHELVHVAQYAEIFEKAPTTSQRVEELTEFARSVTEKEWMQWNWDLEKEAYRLAERVEYELLSPEEKIKSEEQWRVSAEKLGITVAEFKKETYEGVEQLIKAQYEKGWVTSWKLYRGELALPPPEMPKTRLGY